MHNRSDKAGLVCFFQCCLKKVAIFSTIVKRLTSLAAKYCLDAMSYTILRFGKYLAFLDGI